MTSNTLFIIIMSILSINFLVDWLIGYLNYKNFDKSLPNEVSDIYDNETYQKSQQYKSVNYKFSSRSELFSFAIMILFFILDGFKYVDEFARSIANNPINITLIFFGVILFINNIISIPFSYYQIFVIEEKFGFNKTTKTTFFADILKTWSLVGIFGSTILSFVTWFYNQVGDSFWLYTWGLITIFSLFMNMFYTKLIVPLFNKQFPLEEGSLKNAIVNYAKSVNFKLDNIFIIDGSKRSTKANAYFSGFGKTKRINLYDTLINTLDEKEVVAVLAHEVGHYKKKHIIFNILISIFTTGLMLFILSICLKFPEVSYALRVETPSFHVGLISFTILYTPISKIINIFMNKISRIFEYQADTFAKTTFDGKPLISSLKKLSKESLSNLTPHPAYVFFHYSHPTLTNRIINLKK